MALRRCTHRSTSSTATASTAPSSSTGPPPTTWWQPTCPPQSARAGRQALASFADVEDPRPYVDEVLDDEFPLSMFYTSLRAKLAPVLTRP